MKTSQKLLAIFLAVLCIASVFSISTFAATKYKDYGGKYGSIVPVKSDYKTVCDTYKINGAKGSLSFSFKSKGYEKNVYYGVTVYSDVKMQNILINIGKPFPTVNSYGNITVDFSPLDSGVYYGIAYTFVKSGDNYVVDSSNIYQYKIVVNKVGSSTLKITETSALYGCNYLEWNPIEYADGYYVYRKQVGEAWQVVAKTSDCAFKDENIPAGEKYIYTVRAYDTDGNYKSLYNKNGVPLIFLAPPVLEEAEKLADNAVKIKWQKVVGAETYRIYKKTESGSYKRLAIVDADTTEYTDKSAKENGEIVSYKVRPYNETVAGLPSAALNVEIFGTFNPRLYCDGNVVNIHWNEVDGADGYTVFKKENGGEWQQIISNASVTNYTDEDVEIGKKYFYSIVVHRAGETSSFNSVGVAVYRLAEPIITSVGSTVNNSVFVKWGAVKGAKNYNIYRKAPNEDYKLIGNTKLTSFYDTDGKKSNLYYTYYIEAVGYDSVSVSGNNMKSVLYMAAPKLTSVKWDGDGNAVKWARVAGATAYKVYRKTLTGSYKMVAQVSGNSFEYVDTTAKKGGKYYYTVRAMNGKVAGAYEIGKGINCLDAPVLTSAVTAKNGAVTVKWNKVSGATGYYVYRKTEGGSWSRIAKTTSNSYVDKSSKKSGVKYIYTVKAYNANSKGLHDAIGIELLYLSAPVLTLESSNDGKVMLNWGTVNGASSYRVYRKEAGGSYSSIAKNFNSTSYVDNDVKTGVTYYYTIKAQNGTNYSGYKDYKITL